LDRQSSSVKKENDDVLMILVILCVVYYLWSVASHGICPGVYLVYLSRGTLRAVGVIDKARGNGWYDFGEEMWLLCIFFNIFWPIVFVATYLLAKIVSRGFGKVTRVLIFLVLACMTTVILTIVAFAWRR